ncbi:MAG: DNA topoisomerase I [Terriglobia bacterium]|nr:MAG: DNA topoisomerase I [Terriglobia bacterium]
MFSMDPRESAAEAGLRYVTGYGLGVRRVRCGKSFRYLAPDGRPLRDMQQLQRIRSLAIPPAWRDVWICPYPHGHLQAFGWDARGRKQYRYHPLYRSTRDQAKFSRMIAFGAVLAVIRQGVERDLALRGLPKQKVLATIVRLLETAFLRIGNDEYAKENDSFGLTTLGNRHVSIEGTRLRFRFRGKSGLEHVVELTNSRLAKIVKRCQELPGYHLFEYVEAGGEVCSIDSADVNDYIRKLSGQDFTAKDFRTWAGTVLAAEALYKAGPAATAAAAKRKVVSALTHVARRLGNRPATCRKYYVHPAIIDAYSEGSLFRVMEEGKHQHAAYSGLGLRPEEYSVMVIVAEHQERVARQARGKAA